MKKQALIWGHTLRIIKLKPICSPVMLFDWFSLWQQDLELFRMKFEPLFSVPSHLWELRRGLWWKVDCQAEIKLLQNLPWYLFLPEDPQDPARIRLHCPLPSHTTQDSLAIFEALYSPLHSFSLQGSWQKRMRSCLLSNTSYYVWYLEQESFLCAFPCNPHQKT